MEEDWFWFEVCLEFGPGKHEEVFNDAVKAVRLFFDVGDQFLASRFVKRFAPHAQHAGATMDDGDGRTQFVGDEAKEFVLCFVRDLQLSSDTLGFFVVPGVVDGQPKASAQVFSDEQVRGCVALPFFVGGEVDRSTDLALGIDGYDHERLQADFPVGAPKFWRRNQVIQSGEINSWGELRPARSHNKGGALRRIGVRDFSVAETLGQWFECRILGDYGDPMDSLVVVGDVNDAPVGESRDDEVREILEQLTRVKGGTQQRAGVGQQA